MADDFRPKAHDDRPMAADEVAGVLYPRFKLVWGANNTCTDASAAAPLPTVLTAGSTLASDAGIQYRANATGAASRAHLVSANTTNATVVKNAAGRLLGWSVQNTNAAARYVKLHNIATAPTAGTGVVQTIGVPANSVREFQMPGGIAFSTGIGMTTTTGSADSDSQAVGAGDLVIDLFYA